MTESSICDRLNSKYIGNCKYKLATAFIFGYGESDFFVQKENGYAYEFEVKISRADFFKDKSKVNKHLILETGIFKKESRQWNHEAKDNNDIWIKTYEDKEHTLRPNKFFYVVPEGLISESEVPRYAGLMYVPEQDWKDIITVKEAPFIHKDKLSFEKVLCNKFYYYWINSKKTIRDLEQKVKYYESINKAIL